MRDQANQRIWRVASQFRRLQLAARVARLDPTEWSVLAYLASEGETATPALSAVLAVQTGSLANALSRLSSRGLVESSVDPEDGRRRAYRLTESGNSLLGELAPALERALDDPDA